jgi:ComF family protein
VATLLEALAQTILPSTCAICGDELPWGGSRAGVCRTCWESVVPHAGPVCGVCGDPDLEAEGPCLECRTTPPPWQAAASFGAYDGVLRELVLLFKSRGRDELAAPLTGLLLAAWRRAAWPHPGAVVAVPMTRIRRLRRGYNQAELLAGALARELDVPLEHTLRRRGRGSQVGSARSKRLRLSAEAFPVRRPVAGVVVLVDDVLTTGSTAAACTRALKRAGAQDVYILTIAKTPRPGRIP